MNRSDYIAGWKKKPMTIHDLLLGKKFPMLDYEVMASCFIDGALWMKMRWFINKKAYYRWSNACVYLDWKRGEYGVRTHDDIRAMWK